MFLLDNKPINLDAPITIGVGENAIQYPPGYFRDGGARAAAGIVEVPDPIRPDERYYFSTEAGDGSLNVTPKPIDSVLNMAWGWVQTHRDSLYEAGCEVAPHGWFHNDTQSRSRWERMVNRANATGMADGDAYLIGGQQVQWKTMGGTFVPLTAGIIRAVVAAFEIQEAAIFVAAETHRQALWLLADVDAVAAYDWRAGWPAVYVPAVA